LNKAVCHNIQYFFIYFYFFVRDIDENAARYFFLKITSKEMTLSGTLLTMFRLEAFIAGTCAIFVELIIFAKLSPSRRIYSYHGIPIIAGMFLCASAMFPLQIPLNFTATCLSCITSLNMYNTYYVHVITLRKYVVPPLIDNIIEDIFLPRYVEAFYPWGPILQLIYSIMMSAHCVFRLYITGLLLENG